MRHLTLNTRQIGCWNMMAWLVRPHPLHPWPGCEGNNNNNIVIVVIITFPLARALICSSNKHTLSNGPRGIQFEWHACIRMWLRMWNRTCHSVNPHNPSARTLRQADIIFPHPGICIPSKRHETHEVEENTLLSLFFLDAAQSPPESIAFGVALRSFWLLNVETRAN